MRLFVSEYLTCGACAARFADDSLLQEGKSMLMAVLADLKRILDCRVVTTWDARLGPAGFDGVQLVSVNDPLEERQVFQELAAECDATFVIAPEFDRILVDRRELVDAVGGRFLGSSRSAIELCADKLRLAKHLQQIGLLTIETTRFDPGLPLSNSPFPIVIKPRFGAGSLNMCLISNQEELDRRPHVCSEALGLRADVWQPYISGLALSAAALISTEHQKIDVFPLGEQKLSSDGRFRYLGGRIPVRRNLVKAAELLLCSACESIPGLSGYVGFDLLLPDDSEHDLFIVEINPRLTTSYLGYRRLTDDHLAERLLFPECEFPSIVWKPNHVVFLPNGSVSVDE